MNYSFEYVFGMGSLVLLAFYLLAGIPLSIAADRIAYRIAYRSRRLIPARFALYRILGVGFGLVFWLRPLFMNIGRGDNWSNLAAALTLFGASGALFGFYQWLIERLFHSSK